MKPWYKALCRAEMLVAKYILLLLSFLVFAAAVARTIRHPINWAIDVATFLFAWCVFIGGDIALRENRLFCITLVTSKLSPRAQEILKIVNYLIIAVFLVWMTGYGSYLSYTTRLRTFQGIPGFSYTWVTLSVPVGCLLMLVTVVRRIREFARAARGGAPEAKEGGPTTEVI